MSTENQIILISAYLYWALGALSLLVTIFVRADPDSRNRRHLLLATLLSCAEAFVCMSMYNTGMYLSRFGLILFSVAMQLGAISFIVMILDLGDRASFKNVVCNVLCFAIAVLGWAL